MTLLSLLVYCNNVSIFGIAPFNEKITAIAKTIFRSSLKPH
nr:MAG TPA: hypothetical protein [Caudoviricetes sp.]